MIKVLLYENEDGVNRIRVSGHAGYADIGKDIVCAAVSMLVINTINSLEKFSKSCIDVVEKNDTIELSIKEFDSESRVLMKSLVLGLESIEKEYDGYIKLTYRR